MAHAELKIDIHHVTRVEGHGNIVIDVHDGVLEQCNLEIVEAPRFFEAMLRGHPYNQASLISSRICGICAATHATASLRAVESALAITPSRQTIQLRKLVLMGEMLDSHILHIYMLALPDLLGANSVIQLAKDAPEAVGRALRMKKLAGDLCAAIAGRHTHPVAMTVGGFTHFPSTEILCELQERLTASRLDLDATVDLFQGLKLPEFERDSEYLALSSPDEYDFYNGMIASTDGGQWPIEGYREVTNEYLHTHSSAKHCRNQRQSYMVGSLARFNLNHAKLHPRAKMAASALNLVPKCTNPYMNVTAQLVEVVHCTEQSIKIIQELLESGLPPEPPVPPSRLSGAGVGACEAPRGTLYHHYTIRDGLLRDANCVIPTGQNLANIEADMRQLVPRLLDRSRDEVTLALESLVRAYDPCISCATHFLDVRYV
jgi:coenzyme F420-reducing hydrogenase alpha subunit